MTSFSDAHLVEIYLAHSLAFSLSLLVYLRSEVSWRVICWILANLLGAAGFTALSLRGDEVSPLTFLLPNTLNFLGGALRAIAFMKPLSRGRFPRPVERPDVWLLITSLIIFTLVLVPALSDYRLLLVLLSAMMLPLSASMSLIKNRLWRGSAGQKLMLSCLIFAISGFTWRMCYAYPIGPHRTFIGNAPEQYAGIVLMLLISFFMQISFVVLIAERLNRTVRFTERRAARVIERDQQLRKQHQTSQALAEERLNMLNILTHEVRQPLNNAQAALQSVLAEIEPETIQRSKLRSAAMRTQSVLDDITLALSNSIVGATVIQNKIAPRLRECEILAITELARTDCPSEQARQIIIKATEPEIFLAVDPVLLRLALRNLLHNAAKFSPCGTPVELKISIDQDRFGISFAVSNALEMPIMLPTENFTLTNSQPALPANGERLGLHVVKEIVRVHQGQARIIQHDPAHVTFEIFIPK